MASATLAQLGPRFGIGTNVSAYLRSQWPNNQLVGAPSGAAVAGPVVIDTNGNATFTGLTADTEYILYAGSPDRYTSFVVPTGGVMRSATDVEIVAGGAGGGTVDTELPAAAALADATANPTVPGVSAFPLVWNGTTWDRLREMISSDFFGPAGILGAGLLVIRPGSSNLDRLGNMRGRADGDDGTQSLGVHGQIFNGVTFDRTRTPNVFKSFASTAITAGTGATIWTPAAGKKFRLMGYMISSSVAGVLIFGDNVVGTVIARSAAVAAAGIAQLGAADMGNGILSAAANNVLKLDGPTGNVAGMVWGVEE